MSVSMSASMSVAATSTATETRAESAESTTPNMALWWQAMEESMHRFFTGGNNRNNGNHGNNEAREIPASASTTTTTAAFNMVPIVTPSTIAIPVGHRDTLELIRHIDSNNHRNVIHALDNGALGVADLIHVLQYLTTRIQSTPHHANVPMWQACKRDITFRVICQVRQHDPSQ